MLEKIWKQTYVKMGIFLQNLIISFMLNSMMSEKCCMCALLAPELPGAVATIFCVMLFILWRIITSQVSMTARQLYFFYSYSQIRKSWAGAGCWRCWWTVTTIYRRLVNNLLILKLRPKIIYRNNVMREDGKFEKSLLTHFACTARIDWDDLMNYA